MRYSPAAAQQLVTHPLKLHYFRDPHGNFGDDLNPWLWPQVAPGLLDDDASELLVGIGTLLNHRLPAAPKKHVMGSGAGYGDVPRLGPDFVVHAVRGPKTAQLLGLPAERAITDAAVLIRGLPLPAAAPRAKVGVMFTGHALRHFDWQPLCEQAGFRFISCHWSVERVLAAMLGCDVLLTEAMHGAIVADALRVPWVPITCSEIVLSFKWQDWLASLEMAYEPSTVLPLADPRRLNRGLRGRSVDAIKRSAHGLGLWRSGWGDVPLPPARPRDLLQAQRELADAARRKPFLSDERLLDRHSARFRELLSRLAERRSAALA
jgi:Polysaccharide pyruvyl transferase